MKNPFKILILACLMALALTMSVTAAPVQPADLEQTNPALLVQEKGNLSMYLTQSAATEATPQDYVLLGTIVGTVAVLFGTVAIMQSAFILPAPPHKSTGSISLGF